MLHKWQIITLKINYGIFDYIKIDINKTTYANKIRNKNKVFNLENELDEPQLESKPKLLFKNISNSNNSKIKAQNPKIQSISQILNQRK